MADGRRFGFVGAVNDIGTSSIAFAARLQADNVSLQSILADWPDAVGKEVQTRTLLTSGSAPNTISSGVIPT